MTAKDGVDLVHWNPRRFSIPGANRVSFLRRSSALREKRFGPRVSNFGDLIGPDVVRRLLNAEFRIPEGCHSRSVRLLSVGSVIHLAGNGDVVWGSGVNGKVPAAQHTFHSLDVRAVRGPLTREWLTTVKGIEVPPVYGDPALLVPRLFPELALHHQGRHEGLIVPNLHDYVLMRHLPGVVNPRRPWREIASQIASAGYVIASSLHGYVLAEAYGVPAILLRSSVEPTFKYEDYVQGTGRPAASFAGTYEEALRLIPDARATAPDALANWDAQRLIDSFPIELWSTR